MLVIGTQPTGRRSPPSLTDGSVKFRPVPDVLGRNLPMIDL
jgi:hypothetical protein